MNAEGKDVISLGIGSPDMPPSESTIQTLCDAARNPDGHGYQPYVGIPELRRSFAGWYKMVWRRAGPEYRNTAAHRLQGRYPARYAGFRQPGRTGVGSQSRLSHLYFIEQDTGCRGRKL